MSTIREIFIKGTKLPLNNVQVEWCHLDVPDTKFGKNQWQLVVRLPDKLATDMKECGFNVKHSTKKKGYKEGDEKYSYIIAYRKVKTAKGIEMTPPKVFERDGATPYVGKIGNGSIMNLKIAAKYLEINGEMMLPARLDTALQIVKLVPYSNTGFEDLGDADDADGEDFNFFNDQATAF